MLFTRDRNFYKTLFHLMIIVVFQNLIAYSINMADNLMLGMYSQSSLSGVATVNQIQFLLQQMTLAIGDTLVIIASQYWGQKNTKPIRTFTGIALMTGLLLGLIVFAFTTLFPREILMLFTKKESYIIQGMDYLSLIRFTYPLFVLSTILMAALRSVETVSIALKVSILSLIVDISINYTLIFGKFGFPEMGTNGAAIGTLIARILELVIVVIYLIFADHKLKLFCKDFFHFTKEAFSRFFKILWPSFLSNTLWALATPIQTGILGRLSADAIAANSVSTTMFQYLKVITIGEASASAVLIGTTIGENKGTTKVKEYSKTLQVIYLIIGSVLGISLFFLRIPLLSLYDLTQNAYQMADQILIILSIVMVGMSYQMPTGIGIIKGGGDVKYMMYLNLISTWVIVMPLSFLGAFVWKLPVPLVVLLLNSDQLFKCIPTYLYVKKDQWIKVLV
mgnify:FL=1